MKKTKHFFVRLLTAALVMTIFLSLSPIALASALSETAPASDVEYPPEIVNETFTLIDDDTMDNKGWLALQASPPPGFEGVICLELRNKSTGIRETLQLDSMAGYYGGGWLSTGTYKVNRAYVLDSDHFTVTCNDSEIVITNDEDTCLELTVASDGTLEKELEDILATFVPNVPTGPEPAETTEATEPSPALEMLTEPAVPGTETTEATTVPTEQETVDFGSQLLMNILAAAIFVGIVFLIAYLVRRCHKN